MPDSLIDSRISRAESVASRLESEIMDEVVGPGVLLGTKDELRQRFGVALATINEAVRLLEARGLIEARPGPGGGIFVASGSAAMALSHSTLRFKGGSSGFSEYLAVRDALEPLICREAARNHEPSDIAALQRILDQMQTRLDDPHAYMRLNYKLHRRIAKLAANEDFDGAAHLAEHRDLIVAIEGGEGKRLEAAIARQSPSYMGSRAQPSKRR
jgi:GntR family transcriptional repressor for pyruvate dehydrogenase complex